MPGVKWFFGINVLIAEVTGAVSVLTTISLISIVDVLLLAGALNAWFARRIAKPIRDLELAVNRVAAGDMRSSKLEIASNDEIGRLGLAFEKMTKNLRALVQKITAATTQVATSSAGLTVNVE